MKREPIEVDGVRWETLSPVASHVRAIRARVDLLEQALQRIEGHTTPSSAPIDPKWINAIATQALKS